jgi:23S rRNA (adenine2503-C2)-methyltransferase
MLLTLQLTFLKEMGAKSHIRSLSFKELEYQLKVLGCNTFFFKKIYSAIWDKFYFNFYDIPDLKENEINLLEQHFYFQKSTIFQQQNSSDGTIKFSILLMDNNIIEAVLIPNKNRVTICISSQVGCSLSCAFCATGKMERKRNLEVFEFIDQLLLLNPISIETYNMPISNIVYMGMGEPLLNYKNVVESVRHFTNQKGLNIAPKRITISTAGIAKKIAQLGDENLKVNLALSLHAADDLKRSAMMGINESNNIEQLLNALNIFYTKCKSPITIEYLLLDHENDSDVDALKLVSFCKKAPIHLVNLIEYNKVSYINFDQTPISNIHPFSQILKAHGINVFIRRSRGKDIDAACGQLANQ